MIRARVSSPCMERLDGLAWAADVAFDAYGVRFGVRVNQAQTLEHLQSLFPPGWRPSSAPIVDWLFSLWVGESRGRVRKFHMLYAGTRRRARTFDLDEACTTLEADLRQAVAAHARRRIFVHAGVVGWQGGAILLPGRSWSGKTTLVRELVRAGAVYYSDEFAVVGADGRVHPFAKPLSIREGEHIRRCTAEELGGITGGPPLPVSAVIFTEHRPGARWRSARYSPAMGLLELLRHAVPVRRRPESTLAALETLVRRAVILKGARGDAAAAARAILDRAAEWGRGVSAGAERG
jgi:hypothetical protein